MDAYDNLYDIGYDSAEAELAREDRTHEDLDSLDDHVFPPAFAEALDAAPDYPAEDISTEVHLGISDAWDAWAASELTDYS